MRLITQSLDASNAMAANLSQQRPAIHITNESTYEEIFTEVSSSVSCRDEAALLFEVSGVIFARAMTFGSEEDVEESIKQAKRTLAMMPPADARRTRYLDRLARQFTYRYELLADLEDLQTAVDITLEVVCLADAVPAEERPPNHTVYYQNLAARFELLYRETEDIEKLEAAIKWTENALASITLPPNSTQRAAMQKSLARHLVAHYEFSDEVDNLNRAIDQAERCLVITASTALKEPAVCADHLDSLSSYLLIRYERNEEEIDVDKAISASRKAVALTPERDPRQTIYLRVLGSALLAKYENTDDPELLQQSIDSGRAALTRVPVSPAEKAIAADLLANCLGLLYDRTGDLKDITEAISMIEEALAASQDPQRATRLNCLSSLLCTLYDESGSSDVLLKAREAADQALALAAADSTIETTCLDGLGQVLALQFRADGTSQDIDVAIQHTKQALGMIPLDHPDRARYSHNLSVRLHDRYNHTEDVQDLEEAVLLSCAAVDSYPNFFLIE
jgi:tetratricopeptide (TPR) repeat protein